MTLTVEIHEEDGVLWGRQVELCPPRKPDSTARIQTPKI